jgi:peptide chain release factor subunit 1
MSREVKEENAIEILKFKRLIEKIDSYTGSGTSVVSLLIPSGDQLSKAVDLINTEYSTASNIKSRVNRLAVLNCLTSVKQILKTLKSLPKNGYIIFVGEVLDSTLSGADKIKKIKIEFTPPKPLTKSLYMCDNKFHTENLHYLCQNQEKYGFIILDGNGVLFATLSGSNKTILQTYETSLPRKHNKGGQSAIRFARLREEKRSNYITKCCELAIKNFIFEDRCIVEGIIIGGFAGLKQVFLDELDQRLKKYIIDAIDICRGGEDGLNLAITSSKDKLSHVKIIQEQTLISEFMTEISKDTGKVCFGLKETLKLMIEGVVDKIILWDKLPNKMSDKLLNGGERDEKDEGHRDESVVDFVLENASKYGSRVYIITDNSSVGMQFCSGFGGLGGFLRYRMVERVDDETDECESRDGDKAENVMSDDEDFM